MNLVTPASCRRTDHRHLGVPAMLQLLNIRHLLWSTHHLPVAQTPGAIADLRIVQLTDVHLDDRWHPAFDLMMAELANDPPDLLLLTGDLVHNRFDHRPAMPMVEKFITGLSSRLGIYSILGNHDSLALGTELQRLGVCLLNGQRELLNVGSSCLELIGLPGLYREDLTDEFCGKMPAKSHGVPRIVLSHFPDHLPRISSLDADIVFAGHTHGGQVCLPGNRPIITHDSLARRLCTGVNRVGNTWLVVSRGLGFSGFPIRFLCPAEVVEVRLRPS